MSILQDATAQDKPDIAHIGFLFFFLSMLSSQPGQNILVRYCVRPRLPEEEVEEICTPWHREQEELRWQEWQAERETEKTDAA